MMPGMIMGWSGSVETIPSGWHLCDGTVGTIDLRDKFIVGAGGTHNPGATGGSNTQTHPFTSLEHTHEIRPGTAFGVGMDYKETVSVEIVHGTTDAADNRPAFYAFCWIQKL